MFEIFGIEGEEIGFSIKEVRLVYWILFFLDSSVRRIENNVLKNLRVIII